MASENIDIRIREDGARVVSRNIEEIGTSSRRSADALTTLQRALRGLGAAYAAKKVLETVDAYNQIENKLRVVTKSTGELNAVTKELFDISQRTRSDFAATVTLYSRLALSSKELGVSQKELLAFTESVNKAVIISGATAAEASAGLIQFSQSMASGRLQGDELRSVLEQLPVVADVIANQLGITRGEMRTLGSQGKITADQILTAFRNAAAGIDEKFSKTIPTLGQSFTILNNQLTMFAGRVDRAVGFTKEFFGAIVDLNALLGNSSFFNSVVANLRGIGVAFHAITVLVNNLIENVYALGKAMSSLVPPSVGQFFGDIRTKVIDAIAEGYSNTRSTVKYILQDIEKLAGKSKILSDNIGLPMLTKPLQGLGKVNQPPELPPIAPLDELTGGGGGGGGTGGKGAKGLDKLRNALENVLKTAMPVEAALMELAKDERTLDDAVKAGLISSNQKVEIMERLKEATLKYTDPLAFMNKEIQKETDLLKVNSLEQKVAAEAMSRLDSLKQDGVTITDALVQSITNEVAALQELQRARQAADDIAQQGSLGMQALTDQVNGNIIALQEGSITLLQYQNNLRDVGLQMLQLKIDAGDASFSDSILAGLGSIVEGYRGVAAGLTSIFSNFFQQLTDGFSRVVGQIVTGQVTLKEGFRQLAQSILSDLISALVKLGIQWVINATIGQALQAAATAAAVAEGSAVAAAWAPAAAAVSLATFGTNAVGAGIGMTAIAALSKVLFGGLGGGGGGSFLDAGTSVGGSTAFAASGGYISGPGTATSDSIPARLSNGEFVVNAAATKQNRALLESINNGMNLNRYARGGMVNDYGPSTQDSQRSGGMNIQIHNYSSAKVETQQLSETDVLLLIRDEAPKVIAGQLGEANSRVSKALSRSTTAGRKR